MKPVTVARYEPGQFPQPPPAEGIEDGQPYWLGWVGTRDWIVFENYLGELYVYNGRDPETGAVLGSPVRIERVGPAETS